MERTIEEAGKGLREGIFTCTSLCEWYLNRIKEIDQSGPSLRAVIEVNPDAVSIAENLDAESREKSFRSPLHGIPVLIKDSIDTADKMMTTAGSLALEGNFAPKDAFVVKKLREAGAVILGKTNMSEWGYMRSTRACSGWSSRGGQVKNPYVLNRSPLGSSSGSAVAVAANLCIVAIGAEVDGSIVRPSSSNSIVGLKPTVGLISRSGVIGVSPPQDTVGPMGRTVADVAALLTALQNTNQTVDYHSSLKGDALQGARIGVARECFGAHEGTNKVMEEAIYTLKHLGAVIIDPVQASSLPFFGEDEMVLFQYGLKASINRYLSEHPKANVRNLAELIEFNRKNAKKVMPYFQQELFELAYEREGLDTEEYHQLEKKCRLLSQRDGIDRALQENNLDALIAPTEGSPPFVIDPIVGDHILPGGCSTPPALAGYPHITIPAGYFHGLPIGLSFFSTAFQEAKLIGYAFAFEQATKVRRSPQYLNSV